MDWGGRKCHVTVANGIGFYGRLWDGCKLYGVVGQCYGMVRNGM